ncbi:MAG: dienelactone hydrolase family protein [Anaerolineales bacterium]|nr:dienelactone hydrolase family protein [Anaerolineales bacterium]
MSEITFPELAHKIQQHFEQQTYAEGLSLASEHFTRFPEEFPTLNYWRICLAARMEQFSLANKFLETTLASGIWFADFMLRQSPALAAIQGDPEFERLNQISAQMRAADGGDVPMLVARPENACAPGEEGCPAVIFLHSNMDTAQNNLQHWAHLSARDWLVAVPQSSQALWTGAYNWVDHELTREEMDGHFQRLTSQYSLDEEKLIWGGFSMGAEMALTLVLNGDFPACGFVLLAPGGPKIDDLSQWGPLVDKAAGRSLRGVIWMGEEDHTIPQQNVRALAERLNTGGIPTRLETFPRLGHAYPDEFESVAARALDDILKGD